MGKSVIVILRSDMDLKKFKFKVPKQERITDDQNLLLAELNSLLAEEFQAWYQYYIVAPFLFGNERSAIQAEFMKLADDELNDHATQLIDRINELGGECVLKTPETWKSVASLDFLQAPLDVASQLQINRVAELGAIEHYKRAIELAEQVKDEVSKDIFKRILADEEEHLSELNDFIKDINT